MCDAGLSLCVGVCHTRKAGCGCGGTAGPGAGYSSHLSTARPLQGAAAVFIIGGERVYADLLDLCDTAIVTMIDKEYEADAYFPNLDENPEWELVDESEEQVYFDITYTYRTYKRK